MFAKNWVTVMLVTECSWPFLDVADKKGMLVTFFCMSKTFQSVTNIKIFQNLMWAIDNLR